MTRSVSSFVSFVVHHKRCIGSLSTLIGSVTLASGTFFILAHLLPGIAIGCLPAGIPVAGVGLVVGGTGLSLLIKRSEKFEIEASTKNKIPIALLNTNLDEVPFEEGILDLDAILRADKETTKEFIADLNNIAKTSKVNGIAFRFIMSENISGYFHVIDEDWRIYLIAPATLEFTPEFTTVNVIEIHEGWNTLRPVYKTNGECFILCTPGY